MPKASFMKFSIVVPNVEAAIVSLSVQNHCTADVSMFVHPLQACYFQTNEKVTNYEKYSLAHGMQHIDASHSHVLFFVVCDVRVILFSSLFTLLSFMKLLTFVFEKWI